MVALPKTRSWSKRLFPPLLACLCALLLVPAAVGAATITVKTTADTVADDADCSLREAITSANRTDATPVDPDDGCADGDAVDTKGTPSPLDDTGSHDDTIVLAAGTYTLDEPGEGEDAMKGSPVRIRASASLKNPVRRGSHPCRHDASRRT